MDDRQSEKMGENKKSDNLSKLIVFIVVFALLIVLGVIFRVDQYINQALDWIQGLGLIGFIIFGALYILVTVLLVPGSILTMAAGAFFGLLPGFAVVSISSTLGAFLAFLISRYLARNAVMERFGNNARFKAIDQAIEKKGAFLIFLLRLSPVIPFNVSNYLYGLSSVPALKYLLVSWIGMMPGTFLYVYLGNVLGNLASISSRDGLTLEEWIYIGVGLAATLVASILITRIAKNALKDDLGSSEKENSTSVEEVN